MDGTYGLYTSAGLHRIISSPIWMDKRTNRKRRNCDELEKETNFHTKGNNNNVKKRKKKGLSWWAGSISLVRHMFSSVVSELAVDSVHKKEKNRKNRKRKRRKNTLLSRLPSYIRSYKRQGRIRKQDECEANFLHQAWRIIIPHYTIKSSAATWYMLFWWWQKGNVTHAGLSLYLVHESTLYLLPLFHHGKV